MSSTLASEGSMTGAPQQPQGPWSALVRRLTDRRTLLAYAGLAVIFLLVLAFAPHGEGATYGAWSLLPAGTLFIFILMTQQVLEGFIWASLLGAVMLARGAFFGFWIDRLFTEVAVADHLRLLVLLLLIGGLIGVFEHMGLAASFAKAAARLARGPKRSSLVTVVATGLLSNDSYLSTSGVGVSMTPVNKGFGLPRAYSAMLIRSTAEPACTLNPIGSTPVLVTGLLVTAGVVTADEQVSAYLHVLPYLFFSLAIVLVALLTAAGVLPMLGAMRRAAAVEAQEGAGQAPEVEAAGASSATEAAGRTPHWLNMVASIAVVIAGTLITGDVQRAFIIALVVTGLVLIVQRLTSPSGYLDAVIEGMKDIFSLVLLMAIAYVLVSFIADLDFAGFVIQHVSGVVAPAWLPLAVFLVFGVTELLVTLNWSLYILLIPVLVPLCEQTGANLWATVAALLCAGTWGLTASISSDVGLLTASSTEVSLFRHWITNLPYQAIAFVVAAAGFAVVGLVGA